MTYTNFNCKTIEVIEVNSKKSIPRSQVVRIIDGDDELKNIAGRIPETNTGGVAGMLGGVGTGGGLGMGG